ncbi:unnamed protein product [Closterium sp. NIES-64]|nr:unnamed protein product [Closterium sp. NIES-64]
MPPAAAIRFPLPVPRTLGGAASPHAAFLPASDSPKSDRSLCVSHFDIALKPTYHPAPHSACALCFGGGNLGRGAKEPRPRRSAQYGGVRQGTLRARPGDLRTPLARVAGDEGGAARAGQGTAGGAAGAPDARVARVMRVLREDLPVQYERDLDWSIYDASVAFVDPVTGLDGLFLYRGMITSLRLITAVGFEPGSLVFEVHSLEEVLPDARTLSPFPPRPGLEGRVGEAVGAVRSVWSTRGQTRWGKALSITGGALGITVGEAVSVCGGGGGCSGESVEHETKGGSQWGKALSISGGALGITGGALGITGGALSITGGASAGGATVRVWGRQ